MPDNCNDTSCYICGVRGYRGKPDFFFISVSEIPVGRRILTVPDGKYRLKRNRRLRKQQYRSQSGKGGERHRKRGKRIKTSAKRSKTDGKQNLKEEKKERKKQQKLEQARFREEERMRKVQMKEEKKLKRAGQARSS